jgi:hypothetical protein
LVGSENWLTYLMIGFIRSASQFGEYLIVDIIVIQRVEALAVVSDAGIK